MNLRFTTAIVVAIAATAAPASAQPVRPKLRVIDHGAEVEVIATGVQMIAEPKLSVSRERIEVVLFGKPVEVMDTFADRSVMRIDVRAIDPHASSARVLSVKVRGDHARAVALLPGARAIQADDGVHFWIQRSPAVAAAPTTATAAPVGATVGTAANATVANANAANANAANANAVNANAAAAAPTAVSANVATPTAPTGATSGTATNTAAPTAATTAIGKDAAATSPTAAGNTPAAPLTGNPPSSRTAGSSKTAASGRLVGGGSGLGLGRVIIAVGAIVLIGFATVMFRRRRGAAPTAAGPSLDILASRSLGGKNRIVWLGAGDRELVVAVAAQKVSLLGQWRRGDAMANPSFRLDSNADVEPAFASGSSPMPRLRNNLTSSAASGIMRLRTKLGPVAVNPDDDINTGDVEADEQWARDILAATGGRR